jgi:hypothetical protein
MNRDKLKVEYWPIAKLKPLDKLNPRIHPKEQIDALVVSIREFGFNDPVLVDTKRGVLSGHGRLQAARRMGLKRVPVIQLDGLNEQHRKLAFMVAENKIPRMATEDPAKLKRVLDEINNDGFDLASIGFTSDDMARLADDAAETYMRGVASRGRSDTGSYSHEATVADAEDQGRVTYAVVVTPEQRDAIADVLSARRDGRRMSLGDALHAVCLEWKTARKARRSAAVAKGR